MGDNKHNKKNSNSPHSVLNSKTRSIGRLNFAIANASTALAFAIMEIIFIRALQSFLMVPAI